MDADAAKTYIELRLRPTDEPTLDAFEVEALLDLAKTDDADELAPDDDDWTPTYSVMGCYRAIAEGWSIKAAKAIPDGFDFTTDGQAFSRSQMIEHLEREHKRWTRKIHASVSTAPTATYVTSGWPWC